MNATDDDLDYHFPEKNDSTGMLRRSHFRASPSTDLESGQKSPGPVNLLWNH
jgi:hypothetical protein